MVSLDGKERWKDSDKYEQNKYYKSLKSTWIDFVPLHIDEVKQVVVLRQNGVETSHRTRSYLKSQLLTKKEVTKTYTRNDAPEVAKSTLHSIISTTIEGSLYLSQVKKEQRKLKKKRRNWKLVNWYYPNPHL